MKYKEKSASYFSTTPVTQNPRKIASLLSGTNLYTSVVVIKENVWNGQRMGGEHVMKRGATWRRRENVGRLLPLSE